PKIYFCVRTGIFRNRARALNNIDLNGFASFYGRQSLTDIYDLNSANDDLDFNSNTRVGLNLRSELSKEMAVVGQIVATRRVYYSSTTWTSEFDWIFFDYSPFENWNFRFGRQLFPGSIVGEYVDVGLTYPWRRVPLPYHFIVDFKSYEGLSAQYSMPIGENNLSLLLFGGNSGSNEYNSPNFFYEIKDLRGARLKLESEDWQIQVLAGSYRLISYTPGTPPTPTSTGTSTIGSVSAHYDNGKLMAYAEYISLNCGEADWAACNGWGHYETIGYHINDWLPHYTYSRGAFRFVQPGSGTSSNELMTSHTTGLNYNLSSTVVLKTEFMWEKSESVGGFIMNGSGSARSYAFGLDLVF
ncbi:MAG: hypothetical protein AABZ31_10910, partial [Bdellovibrionota bacterium]